MTRAEFDAQFDRCVASVDAEYQTAVGGLASAGAEVEPWIAELAGSSDWRRRTVAQALQLRRSDPEVLAAIDAVIAGQPPGTGRRVQPAGGILSHPRRATLLAAMGSRVVPRLVEIVSHGEPGNPAAVPVASLALERLRDPRAVEPLVAAARTEGGVVGRSLAIALLGEMRAPEVAETARTAAADGSASPSVRGAALTALGQLRQVESLPVLLASATSTREDTTVRESALRALGMMGDAVNDAAVAALGAIARGGDERLASAAIDAVRSVETPAARSLLAELDASAGPAPGGGETGVA